MGIDATMNLSTMMIPIALLIVAGMIRNVRLVICTAVNLLATVSSSILIMYPVAAMVPVSTMAFPIMVAVSLAMSIDYSLFLLARFRLEVIAGKGVPESVAVMLSTSGKIILVSGST